MKKRSILLVEDDVSLRFAIEAFFSGRHDYTIKSVGSAIAAKDCLSRERYDLVLSDIKMPEMSGYELLDHVKSLNQDILFVVMTAFGTIEEATKAMKSGAYDFVVKPFQLSTLDNVVASAFADHDLDQQRKGQIKESTQQPVTSEGRIPTRKSQTPFVTNNAKIEALIESIKKIAASKATVLIQGESGTGKELIAKMIHDFSPRANQAFVAINCAAMPDTLLESELFGHEKGSFTGAIQRQIGKFETSDGGTILLDEISEMSLNMQTKLLRVLQEHEIYRVGGTKPVPLNLRVVASTNRDLYSYMKQGHFREDLYYRINVIPVVVPPLRERGDDIITLANHFINEFASVHGRNPIVLDELARYKLMNHPWYGNVRELRNGMERAVLVGSLDHVVQDDLRSEKQIASNSLANQSTCTPAPEQPLVELTLDEVEKRVIFETLRRCDGNRTKTAEKLGISLRTLRNKLKLFKLEEEGMDRENS